MKYAPLLLLALAACPGDDESGNATTLWMAPDKSETEVKLVEAEPNPY
jgi:hypothetical protein